MALIMIPLPRDYRHGLLLDECLCSRRTLVPCSLTIIIVSWINGDAEMTILNCNNEDEDDDNGDDGKQVIIMTWQVTGCSKSTAHWPDTLWQWWWDLEGSNSPVWSEYIHHHHHHHHHQPSSSSSKNNQHLTIPFCLPSTASRDPSTKSRFGPRVGFKKAAFVQHLKSTYVGCMYWDN